MAQQLKKINLQTNVLSQMTKTKKGNAQKGEAEVWYNEDGTVWTPKTKKREGHASNISRKSSLLRDKNS